MGKKEIAEHIFCMDEGKTGKNSRKFVFLLTN
jgi:hypothetical protein